MIVLSSTMSSWNTINTATLSALDLFSETILEYLDISLQVLTPSVTGSANCYETVEPELTPYDCSVSSGVLNFWGEESEDIYTSEDGLPL